jgi:ComF family protein
MKMQNTSSRMKDGGFRTLFDSFMHLWYPELCVSCSGALNAGEQYLCLDCMLNLPKTNFHNYRQNPAEKIFWGRLPVEMAASYLHFEKAAGVQQMMHQIKYKGKKDLAKILGTWYGTDLSPVPELRDLDYIIPVPLHPSKQKIRGFNQSEWFATGLSETMKIPVMSGNLVRMKNSDTQTRKSRYKRWENVHEIFHVADPDLIKNKHLLLVDDVVTTGATLEASAQTILALNCGAKISIATLAFAN